MENKKKKVICIVGPTASGKTALSVALAKELCGEVVSCDSMQIYRGMDIGTAKPTVDEMQGIPHHMLSVVSPEENYSVARYVEEAGFCVDDIISRGKFPIIVGGTGLYVDSLIKGIEFAEFREDEEYRNELFRLCEEKGNTYIHNMLKEVDPERAAEIHENNVKRVIRALEVYKATGRTISEHDAESMKKPPKYDAIYIGLMFEDREKLYDRINLRVDMMLKVGLCDEVQKLLESGVSANATSMQAIGYKEMVSYFAGNCSLADAAEQIKQSSRRYAKRQMTWFKRNKNMRWISVDKSKNISDLLQASMNFIAFEGI
ncbi:MAG: tRNA (adenosine(37)-N6)-dimethylallyltransferase MiaA [Oscillospiraceae bacterium]|nr:tRNA (adenosine(37)-N6)-dimethylallyltransferase MiaA [Oscillospiraceae bacterium]